jgi:hypothetical protein
MKNDEFLEMLRIERESPYKELSPHARFEIPSKEESWQYINFLISLINEMIGGASKKNRDHFNKVSFDHESGMEGGIGNFYLNSWYFIGCKLYWYDGTPAHTPCDWKKGLLFRNHEDMGVLTAHGILLVADALAELLKSKEIPFTFFVRKRSGREEFVRAKFPE